MCKGLLSTEEAQKFIFLADTFVISTNSRPGMVTKSPKRAWKRVAGLVVDSPVAPRQAA
ncbi:MAG: hypothetical protein ACKVOQ_03620 [Cyclobacteriaceae bacterium]